MPPPSAPGLPPIPVIDAGTDFPIATLIAGEPRAHALMDGAVGQLPRSALKLLDTVSRRWLAKTGNARLAEIDAIAARLSRPGAYFLAVNYEWGCTVRVGPSAAGRTAALARTLDWMTPGLGRYVIAARVAAPAGRFVTLTWPGFTGVLQAMAPGRFSAYINQAPLRPLGGGVYPIDWAANRAKVWRTPHETPAHLLRDVFETAPTFAEARRRLTETPIAAPAIFSVAGVAHDETCVIEREEDRANIVDGAACAANHWQAAGWAGRPRGIDSEGRAAAIRRVKEIELAAEFAWLAPPVLNPLTRLAMVMDAGRDRLLAQGYEDCTPVTSMLDLQPA